MDLKKFINGGTMKKFLFTMLSLILAIIPAAALSSCKNEGELPVYETEYFKYSVKVEDRVQKAFMVGFTELGLEQTELIFPKEIDGIKVWGLGYRIPSIWGSGTRYGRLQSDKLEKLYFPFAYEQEDWSTRAHIWLKNTYLVQWYPERAATMYIYCKGTIIGYQLYQETYANQEFFNNRHRVANVSYMYNYKDSPNDGWYWVDSYDETVITYIPPKPQREGHTFAGWYKEPECNTPWDFENDVTGKELVIEIGSNQYTSYLGIYLYAKWI